jgi:tyrosinase
VANASLLNSNVWTWLTQETYVNIDPKVINAGIAKKFTTCLDAPNYTVFSNTTSAAEWNSQQSDKTAIVVPLESPHNDIHLSVGGFEVPGFNANAIDGAQGDMGEVLCLPIPRVESNH